MQQKNGVRAVHLGLPTVEIKSNRRSHGGDLSAVEVRDGAYLIATLHYSFNGSSNHARNWRNIAIYSLTFFSFLTIFKGGSDPSPPP